MTKILSSSYDRNVTASSRNHPSFGRTPARGERAAGASGLPRARCPGRPMCDRRNALAVPAEGTELSALVPASHPCNLERVDRSDGRSIWGRYGGPLWRRQLEDGEDRRKAGVRSRAEPPRLQTCGLRLGCSRRELGRKQPSLDVTLCGTRNQHCGWKAKHLLGRPGRGLDRAVRGRCPQRLVRESTWQTRRSHTSRQATTKRWRAVEVVRWSERPSHGSTPSRHARSRKGAARQRTERLQHR